MAALAILMLSGNATAADPGLDLVAIPGGSFVTGDAGGDANEVRRRVSVAPFSLMRREVTNAQFAAFAALKNHRTEAELRGSGYVWTDRWRLAAGADWRRPQGQGSSIDGLDAHPVVQVSVRDAEAFCAHHGLRLPSENEWAFAARGPQSLRYAWGDVPPVQDGKQLVANFGTEPCCAADDSDGYARTAPVGSYPAGRSPFALDDMAGNVWEWTASPFPGKPAERVIRGGGWGNNPYCLRAAYRHGNPPDISLDMVGFRCAGPPS
ncbi:formylglycine-generating enzyme family protein [Pelagibius litoralis]|uniref:Formylglycine-generating enzyme family protein n=1 Tax=Pelagibius litoralis TaxID=374515 RepID=A0A967EVS1_9PROT|nr:formylglycine-generating enzyme family protein [Pelagibius litoralis]